MAPGVVVTMDRIAIMRQATPEDLGAATGTTPAAGEQIGYQHPENPFPQDGQAGHPENRPEYPENPDHPENR